MSPDDPRHGTQKGLSAHKRAGTPICDDCRAANALYQRRQRKLRALYGDRMVDSTGSRRRVQALMRLGWSAVAIGDRLGMEHNNLLATIRRPSNTIHVSTAARIAAVYDEMSMSLPTANTKGERVSVGKSRGLAERNGWPPPLAWNDIDDVGETPTGWQYQASDRADVLHDLDDMQAGITEACARLKVSRQALEKWCERHGHTDTYSRMVRREFNEHQREAS